MSAARTQSLSPAGEKLSEPLAYANRATREGGSAWAQPLNAKPRTASNRVKMNLRNVDEAMMTFNNADELAGISNSDEP
ncbi:MAG TPA: hypothetical protein VKP68_18720 [Ramlibacter sp.]|nr:hypothetical protein [Ramlibacter sp.]